MMIGNVELKNNIFLAPMAGITDRAFRKLCREQGCGLSYTEMVSSKGLYYDNKRTGSLLYAQPEDGPLAVQLFGSDPGLLAETAEKLCHRGADIIDINMGCPTPKIVKNGDGCALMRRPDLIGEIVKRVSSAIRIPLTVKIRKGWDENTVNALHVASVAEENGAAAIAVHGRTREQFYGGAADWDIIAEVKGALDIPVIGNGDIFTAEDAAAMLRQTGCDAVMIGRGARGNPWIFSAAVKLIHEGIRTEPPDIEEILSTIERHTELCIEQKGEGVAVKEMRKHIGWYLKGFRNVTELRRQVNGAKTRTQLFKILKDYRTQGDGAVVQSP